MTSSHLRVAEIEVNASPTDERIIGIFRYESDQKGKRGPLVLLIAEIASTLYVYEQLLDIINDGIERLRSLTSAVDTDAMGRFEKLVQGVNEAVGGFLAEEPSSIAWNRVNLFLLEIHEEHLCLAGVGHLCNMFVQRQADGSTRTFDLFGSLEQPAEVNPKKLFSALIFGEIKAGDVLFAGTQNFERLRQELGIAARLKSLPPVTAALDIQQALEAQHIPDDFGAVIVAQVELDEPIAPPAAQKRPEPEKEKSTSSVEKMYTEEKTVEAMLNPAMTPLSSLTPSQGLALRDQLHGLKAHLSNVPAWVKRAFTRKPSTHDPVTMAGLRTMHAGHGSSLIGKHRRTISIGIALLIVGVGGTFLYRYVQRTRAEQAAWNSAYDQAMDKKGRAEASLVYGDDDRSLRLMQEADAILQSLDSSNAKRAEARKTLVIALNGVHAKLRKEQVVSQPRVVFHLAPEASDAPLAHLAFADGKIYTFDARSKQIVVVEPTSSVVKRLNWPDPLPPIASSAEKTGAIFFTQDHKAYRADPTKDAVTPLVYDSKGEGAIVAGSVYGKRLYLLDPSGNMIWRHNLGTSIGPASSYLKQTSVSLKDAVSLAIDSNVYVGFSNGQLVRYLSGAQESWSALPIDPPLTNLNALWTGLDTDRLVIVDAKGKRIVILRKDGKLVAQITSPAFVNPSAVAVDLTTKMVFVTDGQTIYSFDLP